MASKDIEALETQIAREVAKSVKEGSGRGPESTIVSIKDDIVLVKLTGCLLPNEVQMAETDQGYHDVKLNRMKWFYLNREKTIECMSKLLGQKVTDFFYDINPRNNVAVGVFFFE